MRRIRVIPVLLIDSNGGLVKTIRFGKRTYVGDPINAVKIFNDKGVDELLLLDIDATKLRRKPNYGLIEDIAAEAFMPLGYGGGIGSVSEIRSLVQAGVEKIVLNTAAFSNSDLIPEAASQFGSQSVVVSLDVKCSMFGRHHAYTASGVNRIGDPVSLAKHYEEQGAGEIVVSSIEREGTYKGYDLAVLQAVSKAVNIPVVANGGARSVEDFLLAVSQSGCSAVAASSMFIFAAPGEGVLIHFPSEQELQTRFWRLADPSPSRALS